MRKAAGILMIILGVAAMGTFVYSGIQARYHLHFSVLMILLSVFVITGGVFCLRRKYWTVCFISSLLLAFSANLLWAWFFGLLIYLFMAGGIIPLIFVCLRKREWQEGSA
jgi:hypothetical protein